MTKNVRRVRRIALKQSNACRYCGCEMDFGVARVGPNGRMLEPTHATLEHVTPKSTTEWEDYVLAVSCFSCNTTRGVIDDGKFRRFRQILITSGTWAPGTFPPTWVKKGMLVLNKATTKAQKARKREFIRFMKLLERLEMEDEDD